MILFGCEFTQGRREDLYFLLHTEEVSKTLPGLTGLHTQGLEQTVKHQYLFVPQVKGS